MIATIATFFGMTLIALTGNIANDDLQWIAHLTGLVIMIISLISLFLNNHDATLTSSAPGARLYQQFVGLVTTKRMLLRPRAS